MRRSAIGPLTAAGGASAVVTLGLIALAAVTNSLPLAVIAFAIGLVAISAGSLLALRVLRHTTSRSYRLLTRAANLERRAAEATSALDDAREKIATLEAANENNQKTLRILRKRVPAGFLDSVTESIANHETLQRDTSRLAFESAIQLNRAPGSLLSEHQANELFADYMQRHEYIQLRPLIEHFDLLPKQTLTTLRAMYRHYRRLGYWRLAQEALECTYAKTGRDTDEIALSRIRTEIAVFANPTAVTVDLLDGDAYSPTGPIVHIVGRVLPETQTGYTLRTQYTAAAQAKKGLPVIIVGQSGLGENSSDRREPEKYFHQGVEYYLLPGPARTEVLLDEWLQSNMRELAKLVVELRPSILHAQSDFFNALIASSVGKHFGIPVVYESRGFWEESWLSRTITANKWAETADNLFEIYGRPDAYTLRKHAEEVARALPDHVFTLADVMKQHILESADGDLADKSVSIVPNAVKSESFPVQQRDAELAAETGLAEDALTIGYISSMVEYEGVDTLIEGFRIACAQVRRPLNLLLVGDGDHLPKLKTLVEEQEIDDVIFTGRVAHESILKYYGLIDIFVVPRKRSTVTELVTPLKPFEAFSTGRAVILSDVGALQEIADQSEAVESFRADSPEDLAQKITRLAEDERLRQSLSYRASRWVRNYRSWDSNVNEYYRVYRELGYAGPRNSSIHAELELQKAGMNPGELLEALAAADLPPLVGWFALGERPQSAQSIIQDGWIHMDFDPVPLTSKIDWESYGTKDRSWGFPLHSWDFMDALLREYDRTQDESWLEASLRIAVDWIETNQGEDPVDDPMAWYDMALALRTPRLIALTLRVARRPQFRDSSILLAQAIDRHLSELEKPEAFNPGNNHGFYTAAAQAHAAKYVPFYPNSDRTFEQGASRLAHMAETQFAADGVHKEHSPEYHRMLLASFEKAIQDGLIADQDLNARLQRAADALGWMVQPDGTLLQFGDTRAIPVVSSAAESISAQTRYILTDGRNGTPPTKEMAVFPDGGYAFVRSPMPSEPGALKTTGYLAFSAAFHSRAHKHADDLNVVWSDRGAEILTDGGRFGYGALLEPDSPLRSKGFYYAAPERQYVESSPAHNTLVIDGHDHERRTRTPYGSGIGVCTAENGVFDITGRVHHSDYIHRRRVVYSPGEQLIIADSVFSQAPETREGILWFNISNQFELISTGEEVRFRKKGAEPFDLVVEGPGELIDPVLGSLDPFRGWRSREDREVIPVWSVGFKIQFDVRVSARTVFRLAPPKQQ